MLEPHEKCQPARRVLIAEDDPDLLDTLQLWAEKQAWNVCTARSGRRALELTVQFTPDVLIADYLLEGELTGVDLIAQIRAQGLSTRCVLITGALPRALGESLDRIDGLIMLAKPVSFGRLSEILGTI